MLHKSNHVVSDKGRESTVFFYSGSPSPRKASPSTAETEMAPNIPQTAPDPSPSRSACCFSCLWILSKDDNCAWRQCHLTREEQGSADKPLFLMPSAWRQLHQWAHHTAQSLEIVTVVTSHPLSTFMRLTLMTPT